jgi:type II secretory pathway pseudopilin PulG
MTSNSTLIELLGVIVIMTFLAAMRLPVLTQAKHKAQPIRCANKSRRLARPQVIGHGKANEKLPANHRRHDAV